MEEQIEVSRETLQLVLIRNETVGRPMFCKLLFHYENDQIEDGGGVGAGTTLTLREDHAMHERIGRPVDVDTQPFDVVIQRVGIDLFGFWTITIVGSASVVCF